MSEVLNLPVLTRDQLPEAKLDGSGNFVCRILIGPNEIVFVALTQARLNSLVTVQVDMVVINAMAEAAESPIN